MKSRKMIAAMFILAFTSLGSVLADDIVEGKAEAPAKPASGAQPGGDKPDADLAADLKLLQGSWELLHGNEGKGPPSIRSVKTIEGNKESLRRFSIMTGEKLHEHSVDFFLSKSGDVRVFTFMLPGAPAKSGHSFVYKVDGQHFYDIPGLLHGSNFRNYQNDPTIWRWRRVQADEKPGVAVESNASSYGAPDAGTKALPVSDQVRGKLEALFQKHYPNATFANRGDEGIHVEHEIATFEFPSTGGKGAKREAVKQQGPKKGGILFSVYSYPGRYLGPLALSSAQEGQVPQHLIDRKEYKQLLMAPYSQKSDVHLWVALCYPPDADEAFLTKFREIMAEFEKAAE